jgi:hypothetical protein
MFIQSSRNDMGLSENSVPHGTQWFCWSLSLLNGYNWEYTLFSDKPIFNEYDKCLWTRLAAKLLNLMFMAQGKSEMLRIKGAIELITYMVIQTHVYLYSIFNPILAWIRPRRDPDMNQYIPYIGVSTFKIFQPHGQSKTHGNNAGLIGKTYPFAGPQLLRASRLKDSAVVIGIRNNAYSNNMYIYIHIYIYIYIYIYVYNL